MGEREHDGDLSPPDQAEPGGDATAVLSLGEQLVRCDLCLRDRDGLLTLGGISCFLCVMLAVAAMSGTGSGPAIAALVFGAGMATAVAMALVRHRRASRIYDAACRAAATCANIGEVGPLIRATECVHDRVSAVARGALVRLLPLLRADNHDWLTSRHRTWLRDCLRAAAGAMSLYVTDADMAVAVLAAMEEIGTADELPYVERLAAYGKPPAVREAAQAVLPALQARVARTRDAAMLLRPAGPAPGAATLVRPAAGPGDARADLLLRPAGRDSGENT